MKKVSILQQIEDKYVDLGYRGLKLRKVLEKDKEYQKLLRERKNRLTESFKITKDEKNKYVLSTDQDFEILKICKELKKQQLNSDDQSIVKLIKAQLEEDWRPPLLQKIKQLQKKYANRYSRYSRYRVRP